MSDTTVTLEGDGTIKVSSPSGIEDELMFHSLVRGALMLAKQLRGSDHHTVLKLERVLVDTERKL